MTVNAFKADGSVRPIGAATRVACNTVATVTLASNANSILINAEGQPLRITIDNSNPSATSGMLLGTNTIERLDLYPGAVVKALENAASGFLNYQQLAINA